jgi:hypothetical protein
MLGWMFKKQNPNDTAPAAAMPAAVPTPAPVSVVDWPAMLQAALGDDEALLALARESAPVETKLAAVEALAGEAALKLAELEFRSHDRRVHRLAKQRLQAKVSTREARAEADGLIAAAQALTGEALIPANRLVELDRAWNALDLALLEPRQHDDFTAARTQLTTLMRERGDAVQRLERWTQEARKTLTEGRAAQAAAAAGDREPHDVVASGEAMQALLDSMPDPASSEALREALGHALQEGLRLVGKLAALDDLLKPSTTDPQAALQRWQSLPPLADAALNETLERRVTQWQQARDDERQARRAERTEQAKAGKRAARHEQAGAMAALIDQAEAALASGQLADIPRQLAALDERAHGGTPDAALAARIERLQSEYARLKGWQQWGGGRARDELVAQAEALAVAEPGTLDVKLSLRQRAEIIDDMRARWKELDRLGGATSRALWQRFEAALKTAYEPVAAQAAAQRAAREQNLLARTQLIDALDAVVLPEDAAPDGPALAQALGHFQAEWRKLGPIEHTVPRAARDGLVERMNAAVARLEAPLQGLRRGAQARREQLVARAKALAAEAASPQARDVMRRARELQAEWREAAQALPLARAAENALWTEFKTANDAVFSARDALANARDAEFKDHAAERIALIERLEAIGEQTPPAELKRTLAEVDAQWLRAGPAPRGEAAALDARMRSARDAARQSLSGFAQRQWQAVCDALVAKLALCEEVEGGADAAAVKDRWPAQPALPAAWERALAERVGWVAPGRGAVTASTDELLLRLEAALTLPSPPAFEAARRDLKLQAMKAALEGRGTPVPPLGTEQLLVALLGRAALDAAQRERWHAILAAVRQRPETASR